MHTRAVHTDGMAQSYEETGTKEKKRSRNDKAEDQEELMKKLVDWMWKTRRYR